MEHAHDAAHDIRPTPYRSSRRQLLSALLFLLTTIGAVCAAGGGIAAKGKPVAWKAIEDALLRVNDAPIKDWSVYQAGKKADPLLLKMGNRMLLIEVHDRQLFELDPSKVERKDSKSEDLLWDPADRPTNPLATSEWVNHDIGAAFQIGVKIDTEGRVLDLQLQHPIDLGKSRARGPTQRRR